MPRCLRPLLLALLTFAAGCGGSSIQPGPQGADLAASLPPLAQLGTVRQTLATENYDFTAADLVDSSDASMTGTTLELDPSAASWALLGGTFPGRTATKVSVAGNCDNVYLLASHYASGRWRVVAGPLNAADTTPLPAGVMRNDDSTFIAVVCPGNATSSITVSLELSDGVPPVGAAVSGTVRTEADFLLAGVDLTLDGVFDFQTTSAANGTFSFANVPPGSYQLSAEKADHAFTPATRNVVVVATPVTAQDFEATLDITGIAPYGFTLNVPDPSVLRPAKGTNIDVCVIPGTGVPGWQPSFDAAVKDAVLNWNALSDPWGLFHIRITTVEADAEIVVSWIPTFNQGNKMGEAQVSFFGNGTLDLPYTVELATSGQDITADVDVVRKVSVHEIGHCLGLWDHSDQNTDIMFPSVGGFEMPSRRDLLTLYTLYHTPADYTTSGRGPSWVGPRERKTIRVE